MLVVPLTAKSVTIDSQVFPHTATVEGIALTPVPGIVYVPDHGSEQHKVAAPSKVAATVYPTDPLEASKQAIERVFGKNHIMYWVAVNESQLDPSAKNPRSSASGLFQITKGTFAGCEGDVFDLEDNVACAKEIYDARGLEPWQASKYHGFDGGWGKHL